MTLVASFAPSLRSCANDATWATIKIYTLQTSCDCLNQCYLLNIIDIYPVSSESDTQNFPFVYVSPRMTGIISLCNSLKLLQEDLVVTISVRKPVRVTRCRFHFVALTLKEGWGGGGLSCRTLTESSASL